MLAPITAGAVLYAKDVSRLSGFYPEVVGLRVARADPDYVVLESAARHGGALDPTAREWQFQSQRVCDGHDPEGNVIQLRENAL